MGRVRVCPAVKTGQAKASDQEHILHLGPVLVQTFQFWSFHFGFLNGALWIAVFVWGLA